jgi:hypothetical protein
VAGLAIFYVDLTADRTLVVIVVDVSVSLAYRVPRGDLRHHICLQLSESVSLPKVESKVSIGTAIGCDFAHHQGDETRRRSGVSGACAGPCKGRRFRGHGGVAQLVEQGTFNP